ncbi:MAG: Rpn family recombination-promoting nuclease/putative transposase [Lachnospiraceae bacterium]|nr:Rpn family recombination-promoting nuclease/putative transposase [Lachnospiraceae bacterium]
MGKQDETIYAYLSDKRRFAELFNVGYFGGKSVVDPARLEQVSERSQTTEELSDGMDAKAREPHSYYRDIKMKMQNGARFVIAAIENQAMVDYEMPCRIMRYDCNEYWKQIKEIHRTKRDQWAAVHGGSNKFVEKMERKDRLCPVYTMCFYHGKGAWQGPRSLKDLMDFEGLDNDWRTRFQDYGIRVVCADDAGLAERCQEGLREFLQVLNVRRSKRKLQKLFQSKQFQNLDRDTAYAITALTDMQELVRNLEDHRNESGGYNMCKAMTEIRRDERRKGQKKGQREGQKMGRADGMAKVNKLNELLIQNDRIEDMKRATVDKVYQEQLFIEFGL